MNPLLFLAYAGHGSAAEHLVDIGIRAVIYGAVSRVMREMTLTEVLILAAVAVVAFIAYHRA